MTAAWLSLLVLATWGSVARWLWSRDIDARRAAETRASDLADRLAAAVAERDQAMDLAREWMAEVDRLLVDHENHLARCLGELTPQNDGSLR